VVGALEPSRLSRNLVHGVGSGAGRDCGLPEPGGRMTDRFITVMAFAVALVCVALSLVPHGVRWVKGWDTIVDYFRLKAGK
jgi:hypothetical protein